MRTKVWHENVKGRDHLGDLSVGRSIILKWILKKRGVRRCGGEGPVTGSCEHGNESLGFLKE